MRALSAKPGLWSPLRHIWLREIKRGHHLWLPKLSLPARCQAENTDLAKMPKRSPHRHPERVRVLLAGRPSLSLTHTPLTALETNPFLAEFSLSSVSLGFHFSGALEKRFPESLLS